MSNRSTRREALAAITLADLPAPREITFRYDGVSFRFVTDTIADLRGWAEFFGAAADDIEYSFSHPHTFDEAGTGRPMHTVSLWPDWRGWHIYLRAVEHADHVEPLDDDTRAALAEVAAGGPDVKCTLCHPEPCSTPGHDVVTEAAS